MTVFQMTGSRSCKQSATESLSNRREMEEKVRAEILERKRMNSEVEAKARQKEQERLKGAPPG